MVRRQLLPICSGITLRIGEVEVSAVRGGGPGGQHVNNTASTAQLHFDIEASSLPGWLKARLRARSDARITDEGLVVIQASESRSFARNREAALQRLMDLIRSAAQRQKPRRPTRPPRSVARKRLEGKRRRADTKRLRRPPGDA